MNIGVEQARTENEQKENQYDAGDELCDDHRGSGEHRHHQFHTTLFDPLTHAGSFFVRPLHRGSGWRRLALAVKQSKKTEPPGLFFLGHCLDRLTRR